ncbi:MAG: MBG domain-containing protein, partial [Kiritimatiellia bacterium]
VTLGSLTQTYDGTPKSATATTVPVGLTVDLTYNGSGTAPTEAGSYAVTGTVNDVNYAGSATDTLVIEAGVTDTDGDGMIDSWEIANFGNTTTAGLGSDYDGDLYLDIYEHGAGTQPTNPASLLKINSGAQIVGGAKVVRWSSVAGKEYMLLRSTDLSVPFVGIASNILATDPENVYTDAAAPVVERLLYRIQVE